MGSRLYNQQQLGWVEHTSIHGDAWEWIADGITDGAGSATSIVDSKLSTGAAYTYNGRYWIEVRDGSAEGEMCRIVGDNGSGTYTVESPGFSAAPGSGASIKIWKSPEPVIVCAATNLAATTCEDQIRAEADDFWNGYYAVPITGNLRGQIQQITDFVLSTNVFTFDAFTQAPAEGDVILLRRFGEANPPSPGLTQQYLPRLGQRIGFSMGDGTKGPLGGTFGFNLDVRCSGTYAANGAAATRPHLAGLIKACGYQERLPYSTQIGAGSSAASNGQQTIKITTATQDNITIGDAVMWNGSLRWVVDKDDGGLGVDTLVLAPGLPDTPGSGEALTGIATYVKSTSGDSLYGCTLEWEVDGRRYTVQAKGNVVWQGSPLVGAFTFNAWHWVENYAPAPYNNQSIYPARAQVLDTDRLVWIRQAGTASTRTSIDALTFSLNTQVNSKPVQGDQGKEGMTSFEMVNYGAGGSFREILDSSDTTNEPLERWNQRKSRGIIVVFGSHYDSMGLHVPAARTIERPIVGDLNGFASVPTVFAAHDAGVQAWDADGDAADDTITKVPDFAIAIA